MFPETLQTDSLTLRQFCDREVDVFELYDLFAAGQGSVEDVFEFLSQDPYRTPREAAEDIRDAESDWEDREEAQYGVFVDGDLAGYTGLSLAWDRRTGRLGLTLDEEFWGQGFAGECALRLTELAFDRLDLELVAIGHETGNERSKRAIQKFIDDVGGQQDGVLRNWVPVGEEVLDHHRYSVTADEYERAMGSN